MNMSFSSETVSSAVKVVIEVAAEVGFATAAHLLAEGCPPLHLQQKQPS